MNTNIFRNIVIDLAIGGVGLTAWHLMQDVLSGLISLAMAILIGYRLYRAFKTHFESEHTETQNKEK